MMKTRLFIITFSFCYTLFAQNKSQKELEARYDMLLNLNKLKTYKSVLYYKNNESYFHWNNTKKAVDEIEANDFGNYEFEIVITDSIGTINSVNFNSDSIQTRSLYFKDIIVLKEERPKIAWKLKNETKKIGSFICNKAIGSFRGREYTVWYTTEISLPIGPWKLQGLSGIIVEAYDDTRTVQFYLTSLKTNSQGKSFDYDLIYGQGKSLTLKEYAKNQSELVNELTKKIKSKIPRGVNVTIESSNENFLEKEFNFQKNN